MYTDSLTSPLILLLSLIHVLSHLDHQGPQNPRTLCPTAVDAICLALMIEKHHRMFLESVQEGCFSWNQ